MRESGTSGKPLNESLLANDGDAHRVVATVESSRAARVGDAVEVLSIGSLVGRYLVVERLGAGAMGVVYAAYDPRLDRKVALKLLRPRPGEGDTTLRQERLVREAKAIAKLSHPNIVGIFDVGVHEGNVFLAMEYLAGGTLKRWAAAEKLPWREIVKIFIDVGRGLVAAHAEGLIHRDFKPENVLVDKNGVAKVADFGLVRLAADAFDAPAADSSDFTSQEIEPADLTRTGALLGTPAYMAPEQFLGRTVDARTDQFAFCASLYQTLFGRRPFAGDSLETLQSSVTSGRVLAAPEGSAVPGWIRRVIMRGLAVAPAQRFPSMSELLRELAADPIARRRRRFLVALAAVAVVGGGLSVRHVVLSKRHEIDKQAAEHIRVADASLAEAAAKRSESKTLRARAFGAFDGYQLDKGETLWAQALAAEKAAEVGYQRGVQRLEAAVALTPRDDLKARIADALVDYIEMEGRSTAEREANMRHLTPYDDGGARSRRLNAPAMVRIETTPPGLAARIEMYDPVSHRVAEPARPVGQTPLDLSLDPGSYRLTFDETATHVGFHYPVLVASGEKVVASVHVPPRAAVPEKFVFVPEGRFLFGSANEELRSVFLETIPLHSIHTPAFLISRYETTIDDWIALLESLSAKDRELRRPQGKRDLTAGLIDLRKSRVGDWEIFFRATDKTYHANEGEPFHYEDRVQRSLQNWRQFPVSGISPEDAVAYAAWLNRSGRVPGARLCTEREWERASRGADAREFPHGNDLAADAANFDLTYGRKNSAYGPDEVGSHPASVSPFGVFDLVGNVWELTVSMLNEGQFVARGGSFYQLRKSQLSTNRDPVSAVTRDHTIGLRICADVKVNEGGN